MAITKNKKKEIIERARDILKKGTSFVFVNFKGLKVADTTTMRKDLRSKEIGYTVLKKTLLKRALGETETEGQLPDLSGEVALAYLSAQAGGEDLLSPAREVYSFEKKFKDNIKILGGVFEGKYLGRDGMLLIATIPPIDILHAQFVNLINSPIQRFVIALSKIAEKTKTNA